MDDERREILGGGLFARDGLIEQVGTTDDLPDDADEVLDVSGQIVLPGMVNTHHHLGRATGTDVVRGLVQIRRADHRPPPSWKQSAIVLLVLFPVVMLEITFLNPILSWMNVAPGTFIANVISVGLLGWPLTPLAIRAMQWWLSPRPGAGRAVRWGGPLLLVSL